MIRLTQQSDKNSFQEYDRIFAERASKGPNWQDVRRWKFLVRHFSGGILADLGCLDSRVCELIKDKGAYYGFDLAEKAIKEMNEKFGWSKAKFLVADIYNTKLNDGLFNYVVLGEVLEHLERPAIAVNEAFRILEHGGILAISVPLEEAIEPGACDADRHLWSYDKDDIINMVLPYSNKVRIKVLRSQWFPKYRYCWPQLLVWSWKK